MSAVDTPRWDETMEPQILEFWERQQVTAKWVEQAEQRPVHDWRLGTGQH